MTSHADDIKKTVFEFIADLKDNVFINPEEQGDLLLVEFWFKKLSAWKVADHIVEHVLPHAEEIRKHNISFFIKEKGNIFKGLPADRVDHYTNLITISAEDGGISDDDKQTAWSYFATLLSLSRLYKKDK